MLGGGGAPIQTRTSQVRHAIEPNRLPRPALASPAADTLTRVRVLVVTNFEPDDSAPQRGRWVRDQVDEVRRRGIEVDVFSFPPGRGEYVPATRRLRALLRRERFDLVHAHYGLPGWCARLAGAQPLIVTFHGTDVRHGVVGPLSRRLAWRVDLVAAVSRALFEPEDGRAGPAAGPRLRGPPLRARPRPLRPDPARRGTAPSSASIPAAATSSSPPTRPGRRSATTAPPSSPPPAGPSCSPAARSSPSGCRSGSTPPTPSSSPPTTRASGWPAVEALACDVPVLSTPVGIAPYALAGVAGCLCAPFEPDAWSAAARPHLDAPTPASTAPPGPRRSAAARMAERVIEAYRDVSGTP